MTRQVACHAFVSFGYRAKHARDLPVHQFPPWLRDFLIRRPTNEVVREVVLVVTGRPKNASSFEPLQGREQRRSPEAGDPAEQVKTERSSHRRAPRADSTAGFVQRGELLRNHRLERAAGAMASFAVYPGEFQAKSGLPSLSAKTAAASTAGSIASTSSAVSDALKAAREISSTR